jgi:hypothetical protein
MSCEEGKPVTHVTCRAAQADIYRKHAADPDYGTEDVHGEGDGGHERAPVRETNSKWVAVILLASPTDSVRGAKGSCGSTGWEPEAHGEVSPRE